MSFPGIVLRNSRESFRGSFREQAMRNSSGAVAASLRAHAGNSLSLPSHPPLPTTPARSRPAVISPGTARPHLARSALPNARPTRSPVTGPCSLGGNPAAMVVSLARPEALRPIGDSHFAVQPQGRLRLDLSSPAAPWSVPGRSRWIPAASAPHAGAAGTASQYHPPRPGQ